MTCMMTMMMDTMVYCQEFNFELDKILNNLQRRPDASDSHSYLYYLYTQD